MTSSERPCTVLVVDDSPTMRGMIQRALVAGGYHVVSAADGVDALRQLQDTTVHAILTDINMPRMDGLAFIRAVRQQDGFARTPILALTTEGEANMKAAGKAAGATGWLVKPFDPEQLRETVGLVIRRAASRPQATTTPQGHGA
jgi:two-component system chemotaxis response regulator CheY